MIFERFLNPGRVSLPDIDIDFCQVRREEVIANERQKYGAESVAQIVTFGTTDRRGVGATMVANYRPHPSESAWMPGT